MFKFNIDFLGCKVNLSDSINLERILEKNDGIKTTHYDADIYVFYGCIVTEKAEHKTISKIEKIKRNNSNAKIYIAGCKSEKIEKLGVLPISELKKDFDEEIIFSEPQNISREFIKIQEGCDNSCTYCIIRIARGPAREMHFDEIIKNVKKAENNNFAEIVIVGTNIGQYKNLHLLIQSMLDATSKVRFRISSLHPDEISDELIELVASNDRVCKHFHLSVQSPSTKVLSEMKRNYDSQAVSKTLIKINERVKNVFVGMDIITGYPTETESDFNETLEFFKNHPWSKLHVFPFSKRAGTEAYELTAIAGKILNKRSETLRNLSEQRLRDMVLKQVNRETTIISEGNTSLFGDDGVLGYGESYFRIFLPKSNFLDSKSNYSNGKTIKVKILEAKDIYLIAKEIE